MDYPDELKRKMDRAAWERQVELSQQDQQQVSVATFIARFNGLRIPFQVVTSAVQEGIGGA